MDVSEDNQLTARRNWPALKTPHNEASLSLSLWQPQSQKELCVAGDFLLVAFSPLHTEPCHSIHCCLSSARIHTPQLSSPPLTLSPILTATLSPSLSFSPSSMLSFNPFF